MKYYTRDKYSYILYITILFALIETYMYNKNTDIQFIITICEYLAIAIIMLHNFKAGIIAFVVFNMVALGQQVYIMQNIKTNSYWGLRINGVSINIIYTFLVAIGAIVKYRISYRNIIINKIEKYLLFTATYIIFVGTIYHILNINYFDNYYEDVMSYIPIYAYVILLYGIDKEDYEYVIKTIIIGSFIVMISSVLIDNKFPYSRHGNYFALCGTLMYIIPALTIMSYRLFSKRIYILLCITMGVIIITGNYFMGVKSIVGIIITLIYLIYTRTSKKIFIIAVIILISSAIIPLLYQASKYFMGTIISYKYEQILTAIKIYDLYAIAEMRTSTGNIIAEMLTSFKYMSDNVIYLIFGKGAGGGINDVYGYLATYAGSGGYNIVDLYRNQYMGMHIPITELFVKIGIVGVLIHLYILKKVLKNENDINIVLFIIVLSMFYITKEMLLLTIIISKYVNDNNK